MLCGLSKMCYSVRVFRRKRQSWKNLNGILSRGEVLPFFGGCYDLKFSSLLNDPDEGIQEQAASILRNLSDNDPDLVFEELGTDRLASSLESGILSPNEGVLQQVYYSTYPPRICLNFIPADR